MDDMSSPPNLKAYMESQHPDVAWCVQYGQLIGIVQEDMLCSLMQFCKKDKTCRFTTLIDITAIDYPQRTQRFELVYHLLSMYANHRLRLKVPLREGELVPSVTHVYPIADWYEREVFDMYGILFLDHPDLRRILTDYGFQGFPLRKDFPCEGFVDARYDGTRGRVVYAPRLLNENDRPLASANLLKTYMHTESPMRGAIRDTNTRNDSGACDSTDIESMGICNDIGKK